jgi:menaquinone-dependent protoporphyrinogen IX oxidase
MTRCMTKWILAILICMLSGSGIAHAAAQLKGLLVYDSIYGSTPEVAYWLRAIIGDDQQQLDVKKLDQVITIKPYDYVIIGSYSKNEKPSPRIYKFVEIYQNELAQKKVAYFLLQGDWDETMVLKVPGGTPHLIGGRNYLVEIQEKFPNVKPVVIGGFGGRQIMPALQGFDAFQIWLLEKLAKEGAAWSGLDIWESLVPERVEVFGNEVRQKMLNLPARTDLAKYRGYWNSLQPASLTDPSKVKYKPRDYTEHKSTDRILFTRSRIRGNLETAEKLLLQWAKENGLTLKEQRRTFFNIYYHAVKNYGDKELTIHIVPATMPDDPGNVHISFRSYDKPEVRKGVEEDVAKAEKLLWADGRKVEGR